MAGAGSRHRAATSPPESDAPSLGRHRTAGQPALPMGGTNRPCPGTNPVPARPKRPPRDEGLPAKERSRTPAAWGPGRRIARMRTLGKFVAGLAILAVVLVTAAIGVATTLGREALIPPVAARVKAATGRELTVAGEARVALALPPRVVLTDVALSNAPWASAPRMIEAQRLELTVELLPLLSRQFELSRIELVGPRIALETDGAGRKNWQFESTGTAGSSRDAAVAAPGLPAALVIGNVAVTDGMVTYRDGPKAPVTEVAVTELGLRTRALSGDVDASFAGTVAGVPLAVEGRVGPLTALMARRWPYPVDITGTVAGQKLHFAAKIRADGARYAFDDLVLGVGANAVRGSFAVDAAAARPRLVFDLAAPALTLAALPAVAALPSAAAPKEWPARAWLIADTPVSFAPLRWVDAEGKLAIERLTMPDGRESGAVRGSIALADGKLEVRDFALGMHGGTVAGSFSIDARDPASASIQTRLEGRALSLGAILASMGQGRDVRGGRVDVVANLVMRGPSPHAWASTASGTLRVVSGPATLANTSVDALAIWDKLTTAINPFRARDPSTELVCAVVNLPLSSGVARVERTLAMETSKVGVSASGMLDFRNETLDLAFTPKARKGISIDFASFSDLVRLSGPFAAPHLAVDVAGSAKVIASVGAAIGTSGISAVGQALLTWADGKGPGPCEVALEGGKSGTAPSSGQGATPGASVPIVDDLGKAIGKLLGK